MEKLVPRQKILNFQKEKMATQDQVNPLSQCGYKYSSLQVYSSLSMEGSRPTTSINMNGKEPQFH